MKTLNEDSAGVALVRGKDMTGTLLEIELYCLILIPHRLHY
jgi:hypothetical protein